MSLIALVFLLVNLAGPVLPAPTTFDLSLPPPIYHYADCQGTRIRVYEGPYGGSIGLRWGRWATPSIPNVWNDQEVPYMDHTSFVSLEGCTVVGRSAPPWRRPWLLTSTYNPDPTVSAWSLPTIRELLRVYLPLTLR